MNSFTMLSRVTPLLEAVFGSTDFYFSIPGAAFAAAINLLETWQV